MLASTRAAAVAVAIVALLVALQQRAATRAAPAGEGSAANPYTILGVPSGASRDEVVKAYRALAKRWHPDRVAASDKAVAEAAFAAIAHAYE
eukprot:5610592-Prymnesium_polylepis.1